MCAYERKDSVDPVQDKLSYEKPQFQWSGVPSG